MDNSEVGYWLIVGILAFTVFRLRRQFYALYLDEGIKFFFTFLFFPFIVFFRFGKAVREAREEWAEETIEKHKTK